MELRGFVFIVIFNIYRIHGKALQNAASDNDIILMPLFPEELNNIVVEDEKSILRYGFQNTKFCMDYKKAYLCIRKCIDFMYQLAHADKNCICRCQKNRELAQYSTISYGNSTKWKLGAPKTSLPPWAQGMKLPLDQVKPKDNEEIFGDLGGDDDDDDEDEDGEEHGVTDHGNTDGTGGTEAGEGGAGTDHPDEAAADGGEKPAEGGGDAPAGGGDPPPS